MASDQLSATALTNAFIFLSVGMDLFRSIGLWTRGRLARSAADGRAPAGAVATGGLPVSFAFLLRPLVQALRKMRGRDHARDELVAL